MSPKKSSLKKYSYTDSKGTQVMISHLYIDEVTGIFYVRVYHAGSLRTRSLKTKSLSVAKSKISEVIKEITTTNPKKLKNKLFRDYYDDFIQIKKDQGISEGMLECYSVSWRHHIEPFWGNHTENDITQEEFSKFLAWHKKKGALLFNPLKCLKGVIKTIRLSGVKLPELQMSLPKKEADRNRESKGEYVTREEIKRILQADIKDKYRFMIDLSYNFGLRIGEITKLQKRHVKTVGERTVIDLAGKDTKTRRARKVPLDQRLGAPLIAFSIISPSEYIFPAANNPKKPITKQAVESAWRKAKDSAGLKRRIRFHDLRHSCATNLADLGVDPVKACTLLGMSLKIYMSTYVKGRSLDLNSVVDAISQAGGST